MFLGSLAVIVEVFLIFLAQQNKRIRISPVNIRTDILLVVLSVHLYIPVIVKEHRFVPAFSSRNEKCIDVSLVCRISIAGRI